MSRDDLVASHYTFAGVGEPARFSFAERVSAAAAALSVMRWDQRVE